MYSTSTYKATRTKTNCAPRHEVVCIPKSTPQQVMRSTLEQMIDYVDQPFSDTLWRIVVSRVFIYGIEEQTNKSFKVTYTGGEFTFRINEKDRNKVYRLLKKNT